MIEKNIFLKSAVNFLLSAQQDGLYYE